MSMGKVQMPEVPVTFLLISIVKTFFCFLFFTAAPRHAAMVTSQDLHGNTVAVS